MIRVGCNIWSYHRAFNDKKIDQLQWVELCGKELKMDGLEILDYGTPDSVVKGKKMDIDYLRKLKKLCSDLHLDIYCASAAENLGFVDKQKQAESVEYIKRIIDMGEYLGAPVTRFFAGHPEPKEKAEEAWAALIKATRELTAYAEKKGIVLAVENHNHGGFMRTSADFMRLYDGVGSKWFGSILDTGNFVDLYDSIEKVASYAAVVHAKTFEILSGEEKKLDYDRIFKIMTKAGFNGYFSIEYEGENPDEFGSMKQSVKMLRNMIAKHCK
jgi:sugar phosphate isomerase/epimerase